MASRSQVESLVNRAFSTAGGLRSDLTFYEVSTGSYDFSTGLTSETTQEPVTIQAIVGSRNKLPDGTVELSATINKQDLDDDVDIYDRVVLDDTEYKLYSWEDNSYTIELTLRVGN